MGYHRTDNYWEPTFDGKTQYGYLSAFNWENLFSNNGPLKQICNWEKFDPSKHSSTTRSSYGKRQKIKISKRPNRRLIEKTFYICDFVGNLSDYTLDEDKSERLMLKYYDFVIAIKNFLKKQYNISILDCLYKFPLNTDKTNSEYQKKIAQRIKGIKAHGHVAPHRNDRYYIQKIKPFYVERERYFEVTFSSVNERRSKFERMIAFTTEEISDYYAVKLNLLATSIDLFGKDMPITVITGWQVSIRPCELQNFARIFGCTGFQISSTGKGYLNLMSYLSSSRLSLYDIIELSDYESIKNSFHESYAIATFFKAIDQAKTIIDAQEPGSRVISYLLHHLDNKIIKKQYSSTPNPHLSFLKLQNGCIPFDTMPYCSSLMDHIPSSYDILQSIDPKNREHEFLARIIKNNGDNRGVIYTAIDELPEKLRLDINTLIEKHNSLLWSGHTLRKLKTNGKYVFLTAYESDVVDIISRLYSLSLSGINNYSNYINECLQNGGSSIDNEEKKAYLTEMFSKSKVAFIYGAAGTGKTTLIKHVAEIFASSKKIFLAQTHPAVENLRRNITISNSHFHTIAKFVSGNSISTECDLLIIDECSTVCDRNMREILEKATFKALILVGDIYQIESIQLGTWFGLGKIFIKNFVCELTKPFRSNNGGLLKLWDKVRKMEGDIAEHIEKNGYSATLNQSIFESSNKDEIILCLNYDGLYGINNINRFLQQNNPSPEIQWGNTIYKVGDPVLFNESNRFGSEIYNNMKGRINKIEILSDLKQIQFDIELEKTVNVFASGDNGFSIAGSTADGYSIIRFTVEQPTSSDNDDNSSLYNVVPFQIAYAVSIHKAQGLEYNSVKIIIASEVGEQISHNIFYTAITRAKQHLKIYWTPECEHKVLSSMILRDSKQDANILRHMTRLKELK